MALNLLFAFIGTGIIFLLLKVLDIIYKLMLIPVEKVDAGAAQKHAFNTVDVDSIAPVHSNAEDLRTLDHPAKLIPHTKHRTKIFDKLKPIYYKATDTATCANAAYTISPFESFYHNGKKVNPKKYIIRIVDGNCMVPRNIHAGDLLFIEEFDNNPTSLSTGDILFIKREKGNFKIREYKGKDANDDQKVITMLYQEDGTTRNSSKPHKLCDIKGVVRMKFTLN